VILKPGLEIAACAGQEASHIEWRKIMLRLKGSKAMTAAAVAGGLALMALSVPAAQADDWHGGGNGWGHGNGWHHGHRGWGGGPTVIVRDGYYYAPPPPVYYAPAPVYVAPPPPPVYYAPAPVYVAPPPPLVSLQFRL
jgi:hypothetical protein